MTARPLVIIGGGEHAVVVAEAAASRPDQWHVLGFTDRDDAPHAARRGHGLPHLGDDDAILSRVSAALVLGVGGAPHPGSRSALVERIGPGRDWATIVHRDASVSSSASLGVGTFVGAGAVVQAGAVVGRHVVVNSGATVEHDVVLGDFVHVAPAAAIGGGTNVGAGSFVGLGALVRDHVRIGADATIAMGAVVVGDVTAGGVVAGVPAVPFGDSGLAVGRRS